VARLHDEREHHSRLERLGIPRRRVPGRRGRRGLLGRQQGGFGNWTNWGAPAGIDLYRGVGAVGRGDGMLDFASGQYPHLYHRYWNAGLSSWFDEPWAYQYSTVDMSAW
jgi:hypothetical protein